MMKNILIVLTVLAMASVASAQLSISVDGVVDPPETAITLYPSDTVVINIHGDGTYPEPGYGFFLGVHVGDLGSLDATNGTMVYAGNATSGPINMDDQDIADFFGFNIPYVYMELIDLKTPPDVFIPLEGLLVDDIIFHCEGEPGDVLLTLLDADGNEMDTQIIHQIIPEPMTLALLGLGGLFLRRRK
jgi:hypothetical protein